MSLNIKRHINTRVIFKCPPMDCLQQWLIVTQMQHQLLYRRVTKRQKKRCQFGPLLPFCPFCLNRHLPLLCPETHSLQACLRVSLCPSSNRVLSLSIALDIRLSLSFKRALLFVFFPRTAPNQTILRLAHLCRSLLLLRISINFLILPR